MEGSVQLVMKRMDRLIQESKKLERRGQTGRQLAEQGEREEPEDQWEEPDLEMSLSEPNLIGSQDSLDKNG